MAAGSFECLGPDELAVCLSYVTDFRALCALSSTCRALRRSCLKRLETWTELDVSPLGLRAGGALDLAAKRCPQLRVLVAQDVRTLSDADLTPVLQSSRALRVLRLRNLRHVSDAAVLALCRAHPPPPLEELTLDGCRRVGNASLLELSTTGVAATLRVLNLASTQVSDTAVSKLHRFPSLEKVDLSYAYWPDGGHGFFLGGSDNGGTAHHIRTEAGVTHYGLTSWCEAASGCVRSLKELRLAHRKRVSGPTLLSFYRMGARLEVLDVSHTGLLACEVLTGVAELCRMAGPCLHTLRLASLNPGLGGVAAFANACPGIRVLDLSNHDMLTDDDLAALALTQVEDLTVVRCTRITHRGVSHLLTVAQHLRRLKCVRCIGEKHLRRFAKEHGSVDIRWF